MENKPEDAFHCKGDLYLMDPERRRREQSRGVPTDTYTPVGKLKKEAREIWGRVFPVGSLQKE